MTSASLFLFKLEGWCLSVQEPRPLLWGGVLCRSVLSYAAHFLAKKSAITWERDRSAKETEVVIIDYVPSGSLAFAHVMFVDVSGARRAGTNYMETYDLSSAQHTFRNATM